MDLLKTNQNKSERILRLIVSLFLLPAPMLLGQSLYALVLCSIGGILLFNALSGACMIYKIFGVDTCKA
tara:strand:+ start:482 stop:688 length:207 start_codon:yes stop_codon:yes gene_type:complete